jgi:hypothetical protein
LVSESEGGLGGRFNEVSAVEDVTLYTLSVRVASEARHVC